MIIKTCSKLTKDEYKEILALSSKCENFDNIAPIMFTEDELNYDSSFECYYRALNEGNIISFVSVFVPGDGTGEIYAITDPAFRNKGLFKKLVKIAGEKLESMGISEIYLLCTPSCAVSKKIVYAKKMKIEYSEYLLELTKGYKEEADSELKLCVREKADKSLYFESKLYDKHIGECMVELNGETACIYDFNLDPSCRGRGLGSKTLISIVNYLIDNITDEVLLQVHGDNKVAVNMYLHHGFTIKSQLDYVRLYL